MSNAIRMLDKTFGTLTVVKRKGLFRSYAAWLCKCTCGEEVVVSGHHLRRGLRKCCARKGHYWANSQAPTLAAQYPSEHQSWRSMRERCLNKNSRGFRMYGARGITVCSRWKDSFPQFFADMGSKPDASYTIDRIDNYRGYEPGNCRWATRKEQARNLRRSIYVEHAGERHLLLDVTAKLGLNHQNVSSRLKLGWSLEEALSIPIHRYKKKPRPPVGTV